METRGALLWEPGTNSGWSVEEIQIDPPKEREVLVKLAASGVCHSDQHLDDGVIPLPSAPVLGGHEGAGVVTEIGPGVTEVAVGDHVVLSFLPSCGKCQMCVSGRSNMCVLGAGVLAGKAPDGTYRVHARGKGVGCMSYLGTFSPYVCAPVDAAVRIDDDVPLDKAALIGCGVLTGTGAVFRTARVEAGSRVCVIGAGGIGLAAIQAARIAGAGTVIAVDVSESKLETARQLGATTTVNAAETDNLVAAIKELTGGGVDYSFEAIGKKVTAEQAFQALDTGGTATIIGMVPDDTKLEIKAMDLLSEKRLQGSMMGSNQFRTDIPRLVSMYLDGRLDLDTMVSKTLKLEEVNEGYDLMKRGEVARSVISFPG